MIRRFIGIAVVAASVALPFAAQAQGVPGGVERGSREGERAAGPVGAIVGGVIGGVVGGVNGVLGVDERPRFRSYVVEQRRPSYQYREDVRIGAVLPEDGVTYYDVPQEYGVRDYRYTVVNGRTVLPLTSSRAASSLPVHSRRRWSKDRRRSSRAAVGSMLDSVPGSRSDWFLIMP